MKELAEYCEKIKIFDHQSYRQKSTKINKERRQSTKQHVQ